jgi:hypothetical protein
MQWSPMATHAMVTNGNHAAVTDGDPCNDQNIVFLFSTKP